MAFLGKTYSAENLPEVEDFKPLPDGWYQVSIKNADLKDTRAGTGQYIAVEFVVTGADYAGRTVFSNINILNPNPTAQEIGLRDLNALRLASGLNSLSDTDQLIGADLEIKLATQKGSNGYSDSNVVRGYRAITASGMPTAPAKPSKAPAKAAPVEPETGAKPATAKKKAPWER